VRGAGGPGKPVINPLAGKLIDETGQALTPTHSVKKGHRHGYYASRPLLTEGAQANRQQGWRLPAKEIERSIAAGAATLLEDKNALITAIGKHGIESDRIVSILEEASGWALKLRSSAYGDALASVVDRVELKESGFRLALRLPLSKKSHPDTLKLEKSVPVRMKKRGVELKLVIGDQPGSGAKVDLVLLKTIARAHRWFDSLVSGEAQSLNALAAREGVTRHFVGSIIRLAFLAPEIVELIAQGKRPPELSTELLTKHTKLPNDWDDQKRLLGIN
jgi:site-specific DNA recombinase